MSIRKIIRNIVVTVIALCGALTLTPMIGTPASVKANTVNVKVHDQELLNQESKRVRFKSDVIGDRLIAMTFTYTTCTTICPVLDSIFVDLQDLIGKRLGKDIFLVTMSIDPNTDIPARMKLYAKKLGAKQGWVFLTGKKQDVDKVLTGLDVYSPDIYNHPPVVFVVDGRKGIWKRIYGFPSPEQIMEVIQELDDGRH